MDSSVLDKKLVDIRLFEMGVKNIIIKIVIIIMNE